MYLPNKENAEIPDKKLTHYLFARFHSIGKHKARVLQSAGFTDPEILKKELLKLAQTENVTNMIETKFGMKYIIDGTIKTPDGYFFDVRTIWIIEHGKTIPRSVTLYPL